MHWVEIINRAEICKGNNFQPDKVPGFYTKWKSGGIELWEKMPTSKQAIEWKLKELARDEFLNSLADQEW